MNQLKYFILLIIILSFSLNAYSQSSRKDNGTFIDYKNEFWDDIKKGIDDFNKKPEKKKLTFKMDFENVNIPKSTDEFTKQWHNPPVSQASTNTCWCFCGTSFLESEIYRINKKELKMSEMYTVYWQFVEKARRFVQERGKSEFGEGSQANGVTAMWKKYGCVPEDVYTGKLPGQVYHDHSKMFAEMRSYLNLVEKNNVWNEDEVISTIKSIMNHYMMEPPKNFRYEGKSYTPTEFLTNAAKIDPDDYIDVLSLLEKPYHQKVEYEVPDNWWHFPGYYNVPLDEYMETIKKAIKEGYTMAIGGDVSEAGIESHKNVAMIPSFDIPSQYIDENARQFRYSNGTTSDDHGIHLVGYKEDKNGTWFLIKDSGSGSRNGKARGYYFFHEDFVKLKMMSILVHKSAVKDLLKKFAEK